MTFDLYGKEHLEFKGHAIEPRGATPSLGRGGSARGYVALLGLGPRARAGDEVKTKPSAYVAGVE